MSFNLVAAAVTLTIRVLTWIGLPGLFGLMVVESFGFPPLPSEVILPFAGFLVAEGTFPFPETVLAALAGSLLGAFLAYCVGRWGRSRITGVGIGFLRFEEHHLARMDAFFERWGEVTVAVARLIPLVRAYISYPAGTARMGAGRFGLFTLAGAVPFTLGMMYAGFVLRAHWQLVASYFGPLDDVAVALIVVGVGYLALVVAGVVAPGWPPRRRSVRRPPPAGTNTPGDRPD